MHLTAGGSLDGRYFEVDLDRSLGAGSPRVFGDVEVDGGADPATDTVAFVIRPKGEPIQERANVSWAWSSHTPPTVAEIDYTVGACSAWVPTGR